MRKEPTEHRERRAIGELEHQLLTAVWQSDRGLTPAEALDALGGSIAYTTVLTVLTRLSQKGLLHREREGKAHRYKAAVSEADWVAGRMRAALDVASNHELAMSRFVGSLTAGDAAALRELLNNPKTARS
jgi:predicted transcriptional regulator